jgi:tRNA-splicing ligase RtcB
MKKRELEKMGYPRGFVTDLALRACGAAAESGMTRQELRRKLKALIDEPRAFLSDPVFAQVAAQLIERPAPQDRYDFQTGLSYAVWGGEDIDPAAHEQMRNACRLPVSVAAALMPDAHVGYGLPIGGVLATDNAVIPYAVGVDIACRVKVTVFDLPPERLTEDSQRFASILERETLFGVGKGWRHDRRPTHEVLDADWSFSPITRQVKDLAWEQLGTSGSGNHFVEFGEIEFGPNGLGVPPGRYVAVVSHSGSRGPGSRVADYYSRLARDLHPGLPRELGHLAWLPLDGVGAEYWAAMELMGRYASANHEIIHRKIIRAVGAAVVYQVENHHNFAWREQHGGREVIVHRKGATPAGKGVIGYIPGSMSAPGFLVEGLGDPRSLNSASHGAGRRMSRAKARQSTRWNQLKAYLEQRGVRLLSAGLDESPHAYKDIEEVMRAQATLVRPLARFMPRLVKMAPEGERPED